MSINTVFHFVLYILPSLTAVISGILRYKYIKSQYLLFFIFLIIASLTEISAWIAIRYFSSQTIPWTHFYFMIEFMLLSLFYLKKLEGFINKTFFWTVFVLFELYAITNVAFIQGLNVMPNFVRAAEAMVILIFIIMFFIKVMTEAKIDKLANEPMIWINTAFILYFAPNLFYNLLFNFLLLYSRTLLRQLAEITAFVSFIEYFLIAVGIWKIKKQ